MPKEDIKTALTDLACNCCNGRVGKRLLELAEDHEVIRQLVAPTGVELMKQAIQAGRSLGEACNCCNGRVGHPVSLQNLVNELGGGGSE
jgi:hypothetical protein